jgi:hypothetical protein
MTDIITTADKANVSTRLERSAGAGGGCALGTRASPNCAPTTVCCDPVDEP